MGRVTMNGPTPGDHCIICLMDAKQRQWEMYQAEIQAGYAASGEKLAVIPWPDALTREIGRGHYRAVSGDAPGMGIIDGLCWNHVAGINPTAPDMSQLDTQTKIPPGLLKRGKPHGRS